LGVFQHFGDRGVIFVAEFDVDVVDVQLLCGEELALLNQGLLLTPIGDRAA
jgi:hypothetical protein